ncbi:MAG: radical SAM-associated putative lipoprotein [Dysgonamonadaceae bacterium]|jgi:putative lipoprotein (rSAM/lipoprotein system)|nr:radical SAM-associated putative lipoprotein [Dysgonamonadaceae bacterium]
MKKLKHLFLKSFNAVLMAILALLGFANCDRMGLDMYGTPTPEYGVPSVDFIVKGKVINEIDGKAVEGIRISRRFIGTVAMYGTPTLEFNEKSPVYTDKDGNFLTKLSSPFNFSLEFQDVDGVKNGAFKDTTIFVQFDEGKHILNLDVELKPKVKETDE